MADNQMIKQLSPQEEKDRKMDQKLREDFSSPEGRAKRKKGIRRFFCIMLILTVFLSILNWGVITGWGNVKIQRLTLSGSDGIETSALIYIPDNATNETPAPLLMCYHGNAGNARNHESWAVEFSRRGFVVISIDLYGSGDSENNTSTLVSYESMIAPSEIWTQYALSLPYVDAENFVASGHSMGCDIANAMGAKYGARAILLASGENPTVMFLEREEAMHPYIEMFEEYSGCFLDVMGACELAEETVTERFTPILQRREGYESTTLIPGELYGSFEDGNAFYVALEENRVHEAAFVSRTTITHLLWFAQGTLGDDVPNPIDYEDQVWQYKDYIGLAGIFVFGLFICAIALLLIEEIPFFAAVKRPIPRNIGLRKGGLAISLLLALIFPFIVLKTNSFGVVQLVGSSRADDVPAALFPLKYANVSFFVLIFLNLLGILGLLLYYFTDGRKYKLTLNDLGLTPGESNRVSLSMVLKTLLLSMVVIAIAWSYILLQEQIFGTDFYAWFFGFKDIPINKIKYYWIYIVIWILCFIVASFLINIERRLPTTGKEWLDIVIAIVFNVVVATFTLVVLIRVCWVLDGAGLKQEYPFWDIPSISRLWGMPAGMAVGVGGSTLLYRKTGNTWLSALLMGTVSALMCVTFGQIRVAF